MGRCGRKIVIWTSIAGGFLTALGLYLGISQFRRGPRLSPFRGWTLWHHLAGLTFGVFTLSWVISGTISMNPWGFLESEGGNERALISGKPLPWSTYRNSLAMLPGDAYSGAVSLASVAAGPKTVLAGALAGRQDHPAGRRRDARPRVRFRTGPNSRSARPPAGKSKPGKLINDEDSYYYRSAVGDRFSLPVYRLTLRDSDHTRLYFDPRTGVLIGRIDARRPGLSLAVRWSAPAGFHRRHPYTPALGCESCSCCCQAESS